MNFVECLRFYSHILFNLINSPKKTQNPLQQHVKSFPGKIPPKALPFPFQQRIRYLLTKLKHAEK